MVASGSSVLELELTVVCPEPTVLSGGSSARCNNRTGQWSPALGQCMDWQRAACRILQLANVSQALCQSHEMVLSGGGHCSESSLAVSQPTASLHGWEAACVNAALPAFVYARCCPAAVDSFALPLLTASGQQPLLHSGSFFQHCELVQNDVTAFASAAAAALCAPHQQAVTGGGACPAASAGLTGSRATFQSKKATGWSTNCSLSGGASGQLLTVSASVICCSEVRSPRWALSQQRLDASVVLQSDVVAPPMLSVCAERSEVLLSAGAACPPSSAQSEQRLFHAYGRWVEYYSCRSLNGSGTALTQPGWVSASCSNVSRSDIYLSEPSTFCPRLSHATMHPALGRVIAPTGAPFGFGARYQLNCSYEQRAAAAADSASSLSSPAVYLVGSRSIECQADGRWTNGGQLGRCLVLDSRSCVSVSSSSSALFSTDGAFASLSCSPSSRSSSPLADSVSSSADLVMIAASASCPTASNASAPAVLLQLGPVNQSSWRSSCYDSRLRQAVLSASMQGICCSASGPSIFSTCNVTFGERSVAAMAELNLTIRATSRIRCASEMSLASEQCEQSRQVEASTDGQTVVSLSCSSGFALLPSQSRQSDSLGAITGASTCVTSDAVSMRGRGIAQQWQRSTVTTTSCDGRLMQQPEQPVCCPSTALCSLPTLPQHVDPRGSQTRLWPEGSQSAAAYREQAQAPQPC